MASATVAISDFMGTYEVEFPDLPYITYQVTFEENNEVSMAQKVGSVTWAECRGKTAIFTILERNRTDIGLCLKCLGDDFFGPAVQEDMRQKRAMDACARRLSESGITVERKGRRRGEQLSFYQIQGIHGIGQIQSFDQFSLPYQIDPIFRSVLGIFRRVSIESPSTD